MENKNRESKTALEKLIESEELEVQDDSNEEEIFFSLVWNEDIH